MILPIGGIALARRQINQKMAAKQERLYKVFVYGTLKKGEPNHHWFSNVKDGYSKFLYNAKTKDKYPLIIATDYNIPFLLYEPGHVNNVQGELYEVNQKVLENLDILEEHPNYYVREQYEVQKCDCLKDEEIELVWIYMIKSFNRALLSKPYLESYSSLGAHGLRYVSRYSRDQSYKYKNEVLSPKGQS